MFKQRFEQLVQANFPDRSIAKQPDSGSYVDPVVEMSWRVCSTVMDKGKSYHIPMVFKECTCMNPSILKGICIFCQGVERCRKL